MTFVGNPHIKKTCLASKQPMGRNYPKKGRFSIGPSTNKLKFKLGSANKAKVAIANKLARAIYKVRWWTGPIKILVIAGLPLLREDKIKVLI